MRRLERLAVATLLALGAAGLAVGAQADDQSVARRTPIPGHYNYYNWVDQFDTLGLGENVPIATGTGSDSLVALLPETGETVVMRVPYPLAGFHPRGLDGRIDDPDGGWKGRGVYSSTGSDTVWHAEDGFAEENGEYRSISKPILVKFQFRPHPLAN